MAESERKGPLAGIRVLEFASVGPVPFAGMMLSDMGASVLRIERPGKRASVLDLVLRGRKNLVLDLKVVQNLEACRSLASRADILLEGFRPGVMERLGLGPESLMEANPRLVYARMTGWGQSGPYAQAAGHDVDFVALSGALASIGPPERPVIPLTLVGDYGGGALHLVTGVLAALLHAKATGEGQQIDCAMSEGVLSLLTPMYAWRQQGKWSNAREDNLYDGGAPFYALYACADGKWIAVGAVEPQFYALLLEKLGLFDIDPVRQLERADWPIVKRRFEAVFASRPQLAWVKVFEKTDACVAPVLDFDEAPNNEQHVSRQAFVSFEGALHPAPAPRFEKTPSFIQRSEMLESVEHALRIWDADKAPAP